MDRHLVDPFNYIRNEIRRNERYSHLKEGRAQCQTQAALIKNTTYITFGVWNWCFFSCMLTFKNLTAPRRLRTHTTHHQ